MYTVTLCASLSTELADVDIIRTNIIDSFHAYTWSSQPETEEGACLPDSSTKDLLVQFLANVQSCAWITVLQEILRLTTLFPYSITGGLCLLTELLPIPLPLTVRQVRSAE